MSVVAVRERFQERGGSFAGRENSELERQWLIETDNKFDNAYTVRAQTTLTLPTYLQPHPDNLYYTCRQLTVTQTEGAKFWDAKATYSSAPLGQEEKDRSAYENPLLRPTRTTCEGVHREKYTNRDRDGKPLTNSAGDYYPAQVVDDYRVVLQLTKNVAARFAQVFSYSNSLNNATYTIDGWVIPKGCGKIGKFKYGDLQEENGFEYYVLTGEIEILADADEWMIRLLDEGFNYLKGGTKTKILIPDDDGNMEPPTESHPLDGEGGLMDPNTALEEGFYNLWDYYREKSWSQLPF